MGTYVHGWFICSLTGHQNGTERRLAINFFLNVNNSSSPIVPAEVHFQTLSAYGPIGHRKFQLLMPGLIFIFRFIVKIHWKLTMFRTKMTTTRKIRIGKIWNWIFHLIQPIPDLSWPRLWTESVGCGIGALLAYIKEKEEDGHRLCAKLDLAMECKFRSRFFKIRLLLIFKGIIIIPSY